MSLVRHLPNALTCGNLVCGCLGLIGILEDWVMPSAYLVWAACAFDFLDGFIARLLHISSSIGRELDSLADVVSFGILPTMVMYNMMDAVSGGTYLPFLALFIAVFSALRLARFNIDERQKDAFVGLPTPANALFITALPFLPAQWEFFQWNIYGLVAITLIFSFLLISRLELFAMKFKTFEWRGNELRFTFLAISVLLIALMGRSAIVTIILMYLLLSLLSRRRGSAVSPK